jgi:hypothetical protein
MYPEKAGYKFEYRKPLNDPKNFIIKSHHDLAKLYLKDYMTNSTKSLMIVFMHLQPSPSLEENKSCSQTKRSSWQKS